MINHSKLMFKGILFIISFSLIIFLLLFVKAAPISPDTLIAYVNETKSVGTTGYILNTSGGYISTINLTSSSQNPRWKAFVGYITGKFTLDDATGATIYDWSLTSISGEVYATRNSTAISWATIRCANSTYLEAENAAMSHSNLQDNITRTFNSTTHPEFFVGTVNITLNTCPSLHTYVNDLAQSSSFAEVALYSSGTIIYSTILENRVTGFDGVAYDFQMIVPENGAQGFTGATAYYLYVEIT